MLQLPELPPSARSLVLVLDVGQSRQLVAFAADEPVSLETVATRVSLAAYDEPLDALGLTPGPFAADPGGSCALRQPRAVWSGSQGRAFEPADARSVADAIVPGAGVRCDPCPSFDQIPVPYGVEAGTRNFTFAVVEGPGSNLVGGRGDGIFRVRADGVTRLDCPANASRMVPRGDGRFWLTRAARGRVSLELLELRGDRCITTSSTTLGLVPLHILTGYDPDELYVGTATGALLRLVRGRIEPVTTLARDAESDSGGLAWLGPGKLAYSAGAREVAIVEDGVVTTHDLERRSASGASEIDPLAEIDGSRAA